MAREKPECAYEAGFTTDVERIYPLLFPVEVRRRVGKSEPPRSWLKKSVLSSDNKVGCELNALS